MKRFLAMLLAATTLFALSACGSSGGAQETPDPVPSESTSAPDHSPPSAADPVPEQEEPTSTLLEESPVSSEPLEEIPAKGSNILVVYFSRVGVTPFEDGVDAVSSASINVRDGELVGNMQVLAEFIVEETGGDLFQIITEKEYPTDYRDTTDMASEEQSADERPALTSHVENMEQYDVIFLGYPNWWGTLPQAMMTFLDEYDFSGKTIVPFCSHGGSRLGSGPQDIAALCPDAELLDGLAISGSAVSGAREDIVGWVAGLGLT